MILSAIIAVSGSLRSTRLRAQGQLVSRDEVTSLGQQGVLQPTINGHRSASDKETAPANCAGGPGKPGPSLWAGGGPAMVAS